ncbi:MAG TPA: DUF1249 domain-containing protein [Steroidobacteraceae bacterium]|nr:DUF1249 domain-containing protein [Steroidobacteraceae bacterium]
MLDDTLTTVSWHTRPRSFVALMSLYESNYIRFGWLVGDVASFNGSYRSVIPGDCDLLLTVVGRSPYTTTVNLTYLLPESATARAYPDMGVRLYHDARLAEAQDWAVPQAQAGVRSLRGRMERELGQRWARNVMLNKWLEYCVERGHRFSPATRII